MDAESIPVYGSMQYPYMGFCFGENPEMDISKIIAHNLAVWMAARDDLATLKALTKSSGVGFGTVQRAKNGDGNITVQNLELIARPFKRRAIDLLADPEFAFAPTPPARLQAINEPPPDERELLQGYRDATPEVREIMLEAARKATQKQDFSKRSDSQ